jgi:hypothetical protein
MALLAACAPVRAPVAFDLRAADETGASSEAAAGTDAEYTRVPPEAAAVLGCDTSPTSPVCSVAFPTSEEDSAFHAEGVRLARHGDPRCRKLGAAIIANESSIRMYPKALVRQSGGATMYGVGHAYELDETWLIRIARRINDLNERSLDEKKRTLRHEMSHTFGATETSGFGWSAEDYASRCA